MNKLTLKDILVVLLTFMLIFFSSIININIPLTIKIFFSGVIVGMFIFIVIFYFIYVKNN